MRSKITIRQLENHQEFLACETLEKDTWGQSFAECVLPSILMVSQKIGGVTAGAFNEKGELIGFVYGLTGLMDGKSIHWSHMLAVQPDYRNDNLGARLKRYQADTVNKLGIETMYWTFDPLVSKNAHLNLNKLGVGIDKYVPDMYIDGNESDLHRGIGMDRFIVRWDLNRRQNTEQSAKSIEPEVNKAIVVNTKLNEESKLILVEPIFVENELVRIEIPLDINEIQKQSLELAGQWRSNTRQSFLHYLDKNYELTGFYRDKTDRCYYILNKHY